MKIEEIKIEKLKEAEYNPRQMDQEQLNSLKNSIEKYGLVEPIVCNQDMTVIGGHQRLKALKELGKTVASCVILDLDKNQEKVLNLALNKIVGDWAQEKLEKLVNSMKDFEDLYLTGFSNVELSDLIANQNLNFDLNNGKNKEIDLKGLQDLSFKKCPNCGYEF
jgi:ParB-like chromosome segregation protein Spo0J